MESSNSNSKERELQLTQRLSKQRHSICMTWFEQLETHLHDLYLLNSPYAVDAFKPAFRSFFGDEHQTFKLKMFHNLESNTVSGISFASKGVNATDLLNQGLDNKTSKTSGAVNPSATTLQHSHKMRQIESKFKQWMTKSEMSRKASWIEFKHNNALSTSVNETQLQQHKSRTKLVNDQVPFAEVQLTAQHNVLANEQQHTEQSEPIYDTYLLEKVDSNTTPDSTNMCHRGGEIDQDAEHDQDSPEFREFFEINELKAQLQAKNSTINNLKEQIKNVHEKSNEAKTYKELYDSIKKTRIQTKDHNDSLIAQVNSKTVENADLKAQIQEKERKPFRKVLGLPKNDDVYLICVGRWGSVRGVENTRDASTPQLGSRNRALQTTVRWSKTTYILKAACNSQTLRLFNPDIMTFVHTSSGLALQRWMMFGQNSSSLVLHQMTFGQNSSSLVLHQMTFGQNSSGLVLHLDDGVKSISLTEAEDAVAREVHATHARIVSGPDLEPMQEDQTGSNSGKLHVSLAGSNPEHMDDEFLATAYLKEKSKVVDKSDSTIPDPSHQTVTSTPPVIAPFTDVSSTKPSSLVTPPPINTEATTIITSLPEITPFISLQLRVARLEQEMSEFRKTDHSADVLAFNQILFPYVIIEKYTALPGPESIKIKNLKRVKGDYQNQKEQITDTRDDVVNSLMHMLPNNIQITDTSLMHMLNLNPSLHKEDSLAADIMKALKESKKMSKRQPRTGGSNEGTGNILGVPDESTVISRASSEGTGSKPGVPDEEKLIL
ncbi:hypothetical protein Tco_1094500 [Tanacetum coccineum]|uniref:Uncharacterized protein n=1 Tax=Tanacetum coccineum TaxID=301880 RepID=A0ABQ5IHR1_9ASTR